MLIKSKVAVLLLLLSATPALAQDYVINVHGIVCGFCSIGVAKKISKLAFIDHAKYEKGVKVEIENQMVTIAVKDGEVLDKEALFEAIESGGYSPVELFQLSESGERTAYAP